MDCPRGYCPPWTVHGGQWTVHQVVDSPADSLADTVVVCDLCVLLKGCQQGCQGTIFAPSSSGAVAVLADAVLAVIRSAATAATVWDRFLLLCVPGVTRLSMCSEGWSTALGLHLWLACDDLLTNMAHERLLTSDPCLDSSLLQRTGPLRSRGSQ